MYLVCESRMMADGTAQWHSTWEELLLGTKLTVVSESERLLSSFFFLFSGHTC